MAKNYYYSITIIISLFIISSCTPVSTPSGNDAAYQLNVTIDPPEAGNVNPSSVEKNEGNEVEISASPSEGWIFNRWQGDHTGTANPDTVIMDRDKDIVALFIKKEYPLTIEYVGEGTVSEQVIQNKTADYIYGTTVQLTATPAQGWGFSRWEGDLTGEQNPQTITIDRDKTVTAVFEGEEEFSGGDGTAMNPYQVSNIDELQRVANYLDAHFVQIKNIDASVTASWNDRKGFKPIGSIDALFTGIYDGGGYEIAGLKINRPNEEFVGLFGNARRATIKNTGLVNVTITGYRVVGGLVGSIYEGGTIENSYVNGTITGTLIIGGLTGDMSSTHLTDSYSMGDVSGDSGIGGLVGINGEGGRIINSHSESSVSGISILGGLAGTNSRRGQIENSYATGDLSGTGDQIGGLVGLVDYTGRITGSHATGIVTGNERIGGLVGDNRGGYIGRCYANGDVSGSSILGGLVGKIIGPGVIDRSHARGNVSGISILGGLVGSKYATHIDDSYALGDINGENELGGLAGVSIAGQIKNSYALGRVTGTNVVGGLVGVNDTGGYVNSHDAGQIFNSYAHGAVTGEVNVGGLAGVNRNHAFITTSYSKGIVSGNENTGGLVGLNEAGIVSSYWDNEATGQSNGVGNGDPDGSAGLTTTEMTGDSSETNMPEFDWISIWMTTAEYPILRWQDENSASN